MERFVPSKALFVLAALAALAGLPASAAARREPAPEPPPPPNASFTFAPAAPKTSKPVTLTAAAPAAGHMFAWELDGDDDFDDATSRIATVVFNTAGRRTVKLRVTAGTLYATTSQQLDVRDNRPPNVRIRVAPARPFVGQRFVLYGDADDPDGQVVYRGWDLNGDHVFGDGHGPLLVRRFFAAGRYWIGFRARDSDGAETTKWGWLTVRPRPPAPPSPQPTTPPPAPPPGGGNTPAPSQGTLPAAQSTPRMMKPFPKVRIGGYLQRRGARLTVVLVRAPRRSVVAVRCWGRRCPYRAKRMRVGASRELRVRSLQRFMPAGSKLQLSITQPNRIGKVVTYRIRRGRPPLRWDGCLVPGVRRAMRCG